MRHEAYEAINTYTASLKAKQAGQSDVHSASDEAQMILTCQRSRRVKNVPCQRAKTTGTCIKHVLTRVKTGQNEKYPSILLYRVTKSATPKTRNERNKSGRFRELWPSTFPKISIFSESGFKVKSPLSAKTFKCLHVNCRYFCSNATATGMCRHTLITVKYRNS
jgi:hypothetical protein